MENLIVIETNPSENELHLSLGISQERHIELSNDVKKACIAHEMNNVAEIAHDCSKSCKNANELFYISYKISHIFETSKNPLAMLSALIGGLR